MRTAIGSGMHGENQLFMHNVANYLANRSIIVPSDFSDPGHLRQLANGHIYQFDLQPMAALGRVAVQGGTPLVILTVMAHRGRGAGGQTRTINAMWLRGPGAGGVTQANLPGAGA